MSKPHISLAGSEWRLTPFRGSRHILYGAPSFRDIAAIAARCHDVREKEVLVASVLFRMGVLNAEDYLQLSTGCN